ncbi:MAG TPA: GNAT family N-acetyltransferase [Ignavibacteriaceae bacterium]|nr:GNAT family N-acetyltransferase [Ignavibacteriaceae bacterium]
MIRRLKQSDVDQLEKLLKKISAFSEKEVEVAMELINITAFNSEQTDYNVFVYEDEGKIIGYHCTGKRPLTDAVYDLYWIVADPSAGKKGIGKNLIENAEKFVMENNGRWLLAETSSKESYAATRNFYLRNKYSIVSQINDFYSFGDNLLVFGKYFNNKNN